MSRFHCWVGPKVDDTLHAPKVHKRSPPACATQAASRRSGVSVDTFQHPRQTARRPWLPLPLWWRARRPDPSLSNFTCTL